MSQNLKGSALDAACFGVMAPLVPYSSHTRLADFRQFDMLDVPLDIFFLEYAGDSDASSLLVEIVKDRRLFEREPLGLSIEQEGEEDVAEQDAEEDRVIFPLDFLRDSAEKQAVTRRIHKNLPRGRWVLRID